MRLPAIWSADPIAFVFQFAPSPPSVRLKLSVTGDCALAVPANTSAYALRIESEQTLALARASKDLNRIATDSGARLQLAICGDSTALLTVTRLESVVQPTAWRVRHEPWTIEPATPLS